MYGRICIVHTKGCNMPNGQQNPQYNTNVKLELGLTFIARDQSVVKIVKEHRILNDDESVSVFWEGNNGKQYHSNGVLVDATDNNSDLLLNIGNRVNEDDIARALQYVKEAEEILNPLNIEVTVHPVNPVKQPELVE